MKVYLVRHGAYASSDIRQPLTQQGAADIHQMATYLKNRGDSCDEIWHSPKLRALESAQIFAKVMACSIVFEKEYLKPNDRPDSIINDLNYSEKDIIIVSHLPFIPKLLTILFPEKMSTALAFPTAAIAVVECVNCVWHFDEILRPETIE